LPVRLAVVGDGEDGIELKALSQKLGGFCSVAYALLDACHELLLTV
jgi:hypothetical protein